MICIYTSLLYLLYLLRSFVILVRLGIAFIYIIKILSLKCYLFFSVAVAVGVSGLYMDLRDGEAWEGVLGMDV